MFSIFLLLDGIDFSTYPKYFCKSYQTANGFSNATTQCQQDDECAMISSLQCDDKDSEYHLCKKSSEMIPKLEACTLWKKGNLFILYIFKLDVMYFD